MTEKKRVLFRADGNSTIGLGHIYRCLAIAEIFAKEFELLFFVRNPSDEIAELIRNYCSSIILLEEKEYADEASEFISKLNENDIVILDGYNFDTNYQLILKTSGARTICIDDIHKYKFTCDVIINHAGGLQPAIYQKNDNTKLYLGPSYSIVRSVFWNRPDITNRQSNNVLVCLGGADPKNDTLLVLRNALAKESQFTYHVVIGGAFQYEKLLEEFVLDKRNVQLYKNIDAVQMRSLMQLSAIAICSPSTVSYEYLSIGGELYLHCIADNQVDINRYFINSSLAFSFQDFRINNIETINNILKNQREVFDGKSYMRIKKAILDEDYIIV